MRTIKFRAWDGKYMEEVPDIIELWDNSSYAYATPYKPILLQFTGLYDKNGKEIYEGDIVSGWYNAKRNAREVKWVKTEDYNGWSETSDHPTCDLEVIGNIYENPELLN